MTVPNSFSRGHRLILISGIVLLLMSLLARWIMGGHPVYCVYKGEHHFLLFDDKPRSPSKLNEDLLKYQFNWDQLDFDFALYPLSKIDPMSIGSSTAWQEPLSFTEQGDKKVIHLWGTVELGRDLLAACLYGLQNSLWIGLGSILIGFFIAFPITVLSTYQSYFLRTLNIVKIFWILLGGLILVFGMYSYFVVLESQRVFSLFYSALGIISIVVGLRSSFRGVEVNWDPDRLIVMWISIFKSVPVLMMLLVFTQIVKKPSMWKLMLMIGFIIAPLLAKYIRSATRIALRQDHVHAAVSLGLPNFNILRRYIVPRAIGEIVSVCCFLVSGVIVFESGLQFLGMGLDPAQISLGSLLSGARQMPSAWWAVFFPGLLISLLTAYFFYLGRVVNRDPQADIQVY